MNRDELLSVALLLGWRRVEGAYHSYDGNAMVLLSDTDYKIGQRTTDSIKFFHITNTSCYTSEVVGRMSFKKGYEWLCQNPLN